MDALLAASGTDEALPTTIGTVIHRLRPPHDSCAPPTVLRLLDAPPTAAPPPLDVDDLAIAHAEVAA